MPRFVNRLYYWLRHRKFESDLAEEIEFHRHMKQATGWGGFAAGLAIGFICSSAASRLMERYLYGVSPFDPIAYGSVALVLAVAATPPVTCRPAAPRELTR
jgi:hypothetical protein